MKKLFILSFASILMLTGCGATETLSCSYENAANNGTTKISYDIDHEDEEIKKVRITYDYNFDNDDDNNDNGVNNDNNGNVTGTTNDTDGDNDVNDTNRTRNVDDNVNNADGNIDATTGLNDDNNNVNGNNNDVNNNNNNVNNNDNNNITGYADDNNNNDDDDGDHTDGVGTGTDGTTSDTELDDDGVVDGIVGSAIDTIVGGVTDIILDSAGLRDRHATVQNTYGNVAGFSVQNTNDVDDNYKVTYVIDYDTISDDDLARFNLSRDLETMRDNYVNQGFTCK